MRHRPSKANTMVSVEVVLKVIERSTEVLETFARRLFMVIEHFKNGDAAPIGRVVQRIAGRY
jgi:hypothetical protein